ncbi:MAG: DUF4097 family beta strand repeat protein [Oscillospiraceae bacterium]|nr:DUF4097 family beta strand repeat protein [Oscillospiraceae bacterium]
MKKEEFLAALAAELRDLSKEDIARSLEFYSEAVDERVEGGMSVEEAVADLGGAEKVAQQVMAELPHERRAPVGNPGDLGKRINREVNEWVDQVTKKAMEQAAYAERYESDGEPEGDEDDGEHEYHIGESIHAIDVRALSADVRVMRSGSGDSETHVVAKDANETVEVRDGVLMVTQQPGKQAKKSGSFFGFHFNFSFNGGGRLTVYLADRAWESVSVCTTSGDVEAEDVRAKALSLASKSGDIEARHLTVEGKLEMESMSGDIELGTVAAGEISMSSTSGDIETDEIETGSLSMRSKSGDLDIENTIAHGELMAESISGEVDVRRSDGRDVFLRSSSGDIDGTLLTPKAFDACSVSGDVDVPQSEPDAGRCEARTTSGDISLRIAP